MARDRTGIIVYICPWQDVVLTNDYFRFTSSPCSRSALRKAPCVSKQVSCFTSIFKGLKAEKSSILIPSQTETFNLLLSSISHG